MTRHLEFVPVADVTMGSDRFRSSRLSAVLSADACASRQRRASRQSHYVKYDGTVRPYVASREMRARDGRIDRASCWDACRSCQLGEFVTEKVNTNSGGPAR